MLNLPCCSAPRLHPSGSPQTKILATPLKSYRPIICMNGVCNVIGAIISFN